MIKGAKDKQIKEGVDKEVENEYFYPSLGITIKASSQEEADKKAVSLSEDNSVK